MVHVYRCSNCFNEYEVEVKFGDDPPESASCDLCGGDGSKIFLPTPVIYHGFGWPISDSRPKRADEVRDSGKA